MMKFLPQASESELRTAILECGRVCYERRLMTSNDGNISARLGAEHVLITASGISKGRMESDDLLLLDLEGNVSSFSAGRRLSTETPMHLEVYRQRPDVRAVIHAHPVFATSLTVAGLDFPSNVLPEVPLTLGEVPVTPYATPSSQEDAEVIRPFLKEHRALLLRQHGSLTYGRDLEQALIDLERIESVAEIFWRGQMLGRVERLSPQALQQLIALREKFFSA
jgi:L-fuculose-phosphate aldolase